MRFSEYPILPEITENMAVRQGFEQATYPAKKGAPMGPTEFGGRMSWLAWLHCEATRINLSGRRYRAAVVKVPESPAVKVKNDRTRGMYYLAVRLRKFTGDPIEMMENIDEE